MVLTGQYSIWVKWAPPLERSQLTTIAGSGNWYLNLILYALILYVLSNGLLREQKPCILVTLSS